MNKNCTACNLNLKEDNYKKDRTVCESCYIKKKRKDNNNSLIENDQHSSSENEKCASHR